MIGCVLLSLLAACGGGSAPGQDGVAIDAESRPENHADRDAASPLGVPPTLAESGSVTTSEETAAAQTFIDAGTAESPEVTTTVAQSASSTRQAESTSAPPAELLSATRVYVVATAGSDTNPGTAAAPFATLQRAVDMAQPGEAILVRAGVYPISRAVRIHAKLGQASMPLAIVGEPGAVLRAHVDKSPGLWRGIIEVEGSSHIVIRNMAVEDSSFFGFRVTDSDNITLRGNRSTVSLGSGIYAKNVKGLIADGNDISRFCDRNQYGASSTVACQEGVTVNNVDGFSVTHNFVHDAPQGEGVGPGGGEGIDIKAGSRNGVVAFNTVRNLVQLGIYLDAWTQGVSNVQVYGNRVSRTYMGIVVASEMGGTVSDVDIRDNIVEEVGVDGIHIANFKSGPAGDGPRQRIRIYNNTVVNAGIKEAKPSFMTKWSSNPFVDWGYGIKISTLHVTGLQVFDNIVYGSKAAAMSIAPETRARSRVETNLVWPAASPYAENSYDGTRPIQQQPGFVDPAKRDWHLNAASPAIRAGSGGAPLGLDADGLQRPNRAVDLGALAFRGS